MDHRARGADCPKKEAQADIVGKVSGFWGATLIFDAWLISFRVGPSLARAMSVAAFSKRWLEAKLTLLASQGSDIKVHDSSLGRIGALNCWWVSMCTRYKWEGYLFF
jgi:hypothetical protein